MSPSRESDPVRWRETLPAAANVVEAEIGAVIRRIEIRTQLDATRLGRIRECLRLQASGWTAAPPARFRFALLVAFIVVGGLTTAFAGPLIVQRVKRAVQAVIHLSAADPANRRPTVRVTPAPVALESVPPRPAPTEDEAAPASAPLPTPRRARPRSHKVVATMSPMAAAPPGEGALLGEALRILRHDHDPRGALLQLDDYDRRFSHGTLEAQAALARVEAHFALGESAAALVVLDRLSLNGLTIGRSVAVLRGELRASHDRCNAAISDFDRALDAGDADALTARALWGRGICRIEGNPRGAREDLEAYLRQFPDGARRGAAEKALRALEP
jgi:hypothetical protein